MSVLGVGIDVVHLPAFYDQLGDGASRFTERTFTAAERTVAAGRPDRDGTGRALAGRFAAKEAFLKAWASARWGHAPRLEAIDMREIEVLNDAWGRPALRLHGAVAEAVSDLGPVHAHLSLTHDGPVASAIVVLSSAAPAERAA